MKPAGIFLSDRFFKVTGTLLLIIYSFVSSSSSFQFFHKHSPLEHHCGCDLHCEISDNQFDLTTSSSEIIINSTVHSFCLTCKWQGMAQQYTSLFRFKKQQHHYRYQSIPYASIQLQNPDGQPQQPRAPPLA
jgi:hypothetical protein